MVSFLVVLPLVQCFLFGETVGRSPRGLAVAVANGEGGCEPGRDHHLDHLDTLDCSEPTLLSCRYVAMFKNMSFDTVGHRSRFSPGWKQRNFQASVRNNATVFIILKQRNSFGCSVNLSP